MQTFEKQRIAVLIKYQIHFACSPFPLFQMLSDLKLQTSYRYYYQPLIESCIKLDLLLYLNCFNLLEAYHNMNSLMKYFILRIN